MYRLKFFVALVLLGLGVAFAQAAGLPELGGGGVSLTWLIDLAKDPVALGTLVFGIVASVKRAAESRKPPITWNPWRWRGLALGSGLLLALILHGVTVAYGLVGYATLAVPGWPGALLFGLVAGVISMVGRDGLKTILTWVGAALSVSVVQASPAVQALPAEVVPPEGVKAAPPSGLEPLPGTLPAGAQGFLGGAAAAIALDVLTTQLLGAAGIQATPARLMRVAAKLAQIAPDVLDNDLHLSAASRNIVLGVIMDLKAEGNLL